MSKYSDNPIMLLFLLSGKFYLINREKSTINCISWTYQSDPHLLEMQMECCYQDSSHQMISVELFL